MFSLPLFNNQNEETSYMYSPGLIRDFDAPVGPVGHQVSANYVEFERIEKLNPKLSKEAGRSVYDTVAVAKIHSPGGRSVQTVELKTNAQGELYDPRFEQDVIRDNPRKFEAFIKEQDQEAVDGTPLSQWGNPLLDRGRLATLKAANIYTVEQLAEVPDGALKYLGTGARPIQKAAKEYLENQKDAGAITKLTCALDDKDKEITRLQDLVEQLASRVTDMEKSKKKVVKKKEG